MATLRRLPVAPLTRTAFAPFGDVIELAGARHYPINGGSCERYHDLAQVDVAEQGGRPLINVFRGQARDLPITISMMERHPLGSQAFLPLGEREYLIVVAPPGELNPEAVCAFLSTGWQGVNYHRGVWHHPLLALHHTSDFIVVDRGGQGHNCDEVALAEPWQIDLPALEVARQTQTEQD